MMSTKEISYEKEFDDNRTGSNRSHIESSSNSPSSQGDVIANIIVHRWLSVISILHSKDLVQDTEINLFEPSPIHVACSIPSVPFDVVKSIFQYYGESCCLVEDEDGNLPIHIACSTPDLDPRIIQALLQASPESSFIRENSDGELPLYLMLQQSNGLNKLEDILKTLPKQCLISNEGSSLVHEASSRLLPNTLLKQLLHLYPEISLLQNVNGDTIAHVICCHEDSTPSMVQTLKDYCPTIFSIQDNHGNLPLHLVNSKNHSPEIIQILINAYPQSIEVHNNEEQTPFSSRHIRNSPDKVRALMCSSDPNITRRILATRNRSGILVTEEVFYHLQQHISSLCQNSQMEASSEMLYKFHLNNSLLKDQIESLYHLMTGLHYGVTTSTRTNLYHDVSFWLSFPLFTKLLLQRHPEIAFQRDSNGDLPLHIVSKYNCSTSSSTTSSSSSTCCKCGSEIKSGIYFWLSRGHLHCNSCQTSMPQIKLMSYPGLYTCNQD